MNVISFEPPIVLSWRTLDLTGRSFLVIPEDSELLRIFRPRLGIQPSTVVESNWMYPEYVGKYFDFSI